MIEKEAKLLIQKIKKYSINQKQKWNKVPYLSCLANGRKGWSDNLSRASHQGYWALNVVNGYYRVYVDLETGRLVSPWDLNNDACDEDILPLALDIKELNVAKIIKYLEERASEPYGSYYSSEEINERERSVKEDIKNLGLRLDSYKRKIWLQD